MMITTTTQRRNDVFEQTIFVLVITLSELRRKFTATIFGCVLALASPLWACPFCTVLQPTLVQKRTAASVVLLAEVTKADAQQAEFRIHQALEGKSLAAGRETLSTKVDVALKTGSLVLLFGQSDKPAGEGAPDFAALTWSAVPVDETSLAYFAKAPAQRVPTAERLAYFAKYLEHANPLIAEDAYLEFGHAPYRDVAAVVDRLPMDGLRKWVASSQVPESRKGFYGLALGLATSAADRAANEKVLAAIIAEPADDFRAGFDGVLGGYLMLTGERGLRQIESRYLQNPQAAGGDVRHALTALRFYHEYGKQISEARLRQALVPLLDRPEFAERVIVDLARWNAWDAREKIVAFYEQPAYSEAATRRAIVGYLLACPDKQADADLDHLRKVDPTGVSAAVQVLSALGGAKQ